MDSHSFSDPIPEVNSNTVQPAWRVNIFRRDNILVGTVVVHDQNLPARTNRKDPKKVLWKLPSSYETLPRFGIEERTQIWELFKQQKKERRKNWKENTTNTTIDGSSCCKDGSDNGSCSNHTTPMEPTGDSIVVERNTNNTEVLIHNNNRNRNNMYRIIAEQKNGPEDCTEQRTAQMPSSKIVVAPVNEVRLEPIPPPPGLTLPKASIGSIERKGTIPPSTTTIPFAPPPGFASQLPTTNNNNFLSTDSTTTGPLVFRMAPDEPLSTLGRLVTQCFLECMTTTIINDSNNNNNSKKSTSSTSSVDVQIQDTDTTATITTYTTITTDTATTTTTNIDNTNTTFLKNDWLRYYRTDAIQTFVVGCAQVIGQSCLERHQQWQSLLPALWECSGWTIQPIQAMGSTTTILMQSVPPPSTSSISSSSSSSSLVLLVLTGKTLQPNTGWLAYTLTLLLEKCHMNEGYWIVNDVLTLCPFTTTTTTTPTPAVASAATRTTATLD